MIRGKYMTSADDVSTIMDIRRRVFVEEQGFSLESEVDEYDEMAVYALAFDEENNPAGTGRLYVDQDDHFAIGRVCVLSTHRAQGFGDLIMRMLLARALDLNAPAVYLSAQANNTDFYRKYGFQVCGEEFLDEGVPHRMMRAERDEVCIEGTCKHC